MGPAFVKSRDEMPGIRHSETSQVPLQRNDHVDYLFHRLFALI